MKIEGSKEQLKAELKAERQKELSEMESRLRNDFKTEIDEVWERIMADTAVINKNFDEVYDRLGRLDGLPPGLPGR